MFSAAGVKAVKIGEKIFTDDHQKLFADISTDHNPLHMDAVVARRFIPGYQVVHGIHILLIALEYWNNKNSTTPYSVNCSFNNPVAVGEKVLYFQSEIETGETLIEAIVNELSCTRIIINTKDIDGETLMVTDPLKSNYPVPNKLDKPADEDPSFHLNKTYIINLNNKDYSDRFPNVYRYYGKAGFASISALSCFVGMVCPGLHSLFASLSFKFSNSVSDSNSLSFRVTKYHERFGLYEVAFHGSISGGLKAYQRPKPQQQPGLKEISSVVNTDEFKGSKTLIIGGSRGLGELTAKILAAGGGNVIITYSNGVTDAEAVCQDITISGKGKCEVYKLDLVRNGFDKTLFNAASFDAVYFYATPRIGRKKNRVYDMGLFKEFTDFYIKSFFDLCVLLEESEPSKKIKVFFPSTIYINERPSGMTEYAMAKAAAEVLIEDINKTFKNVKVIAERLPRLNTDQTVAIVKEVTGSNIDTMLRVVRKVMVK